MRPVCSLHQRTPPEGHFREQKPQIGSTSRTKVYLGSKRKRKFGVHFIPLYLLRYKYTTAAKSPTVNTFSLLLCTTRPRHLTMRTAQNKESILPAWGQLRSVRNKVRRPKICPFGIRVTLRNSRCRRSSETEMLPTFKGRLCL